MENKPLASIILLTWNGLNFIEECLEAIFKQTYPNYEVIIVDNASTDGTPDYISTNFSDAILIQNEANLGFSAGINVGFKQAKGEFLLPLNQDTIVAPTWLAELIKGMMNDKKIGIGGCKIFDWSGEILWHTGVSFDQARKFPELRGAEEVDRGQYDTVEEMEAIVGAAFAIRRELYETIGGLDEDYYFYLEDTDYCLRARKAGYKVIYYPKSTLKHYVAASLEKNSYNVLYQFHLSRLLFLLKHYELDWFCHQFVEAETSYLGHPHRSPNELKALRRAYLQTIIFLIRENKKYSLTKALDIEMGVEALTTLRNHALPVSYIPKDWRQTTSIWQVRDNWQIHPHEFRSDLPLVGSLIVKIRQWWSNIAAKWHEKNILQQQDLINYELANLLEQLSVQISIQKADIALLNDLVLELIRQQGTPDAE